MRTAGRRRRQIAASRTDAALVSAVTMLALGLAVELRTQPLQWSLGLLVSLTVLGGVMSIAMRGESAGLARATFILAPGVPALMMAVEGLCRLTPWTLLVLLVLMIASPACRNVAGRAARSLRDNGQSAQVEASRAHPEQVPVSSAASRLPAPDRLDPAALSKAWVASYGALGMARSPAALWQVAEMRRGYLSRLEEIDPDGFAAWLKAGADPVRSFGSP